MRRCAERGGLFYDIERGISPGRPLSPLMGALFLQTLDERMDRVVLPASAVDKVILTGSVAVDKVRFTGSTSGVDTLRLTGSAARIYPIHLLERQLITKGAIEGPLVWLYSFMI